MTARLASLVDRARKIALSIADPERMGARRLASAARQWYKINTDDAERALVVLDGEIGWDVVSSDFARDLRNITAPAIDLHINSPGGAVWDGYTIYNALQTHPATVKAHIVGVAASAASFIAMAADEIVAYRPSEMMIHDAAAYVDVWMVGNPADLTRVLAELTNLRDSLDMTSDEVAAIYARKAGGTAAEWRSLMQATTWYTPDTAHAAGLVDKIHGDDTDPPAPGVDGATNGTDGVSITYATPPTGSAPPGVGLIRARHAARIAREGVK